MTDTPKPPGPAGTWCPVCGHYPRVYGCAPGACKAPLEPGSRCSFVFPDDSRCADESGRPHEHWLSNRPPAPAPFARDLCRACGSSRLLAVRPDGSTSCAHCGIPRVDDRAPAPAPDITATITAAGGINGPAPVEPAPPPTDDRRLVHCRACNKTHAVRPGEKECAPGAWRDDDGGTPHEAAPFIASRPEVGDRLVWPEQGKVAIVRDDDVPRRDRSP